MVQNKRHYARTGARKQSSDNPTQTNRLSGIAAGLALPQAQQEQRDLRARNPLLTSPYLTAENGVLKVVRPTSASPAPVFSDPGLSAAQQAQDETETVPYLHLKGQIGYAQPSKAQLTKEEKLDPYYSVFGSTKQTQKPVDKPEAFGFTDPGLLAAQQAQDMIKVAPYLHMKGQKDYTQPAKDQLTKDEELAPYLSYLGRPTQTVKPVD